MNRHVNLPCKLFLKFISFHSYNCHCPSSPYHLTPSDPSAGGLTASSLLLFLFLHFSSQKNLKDPTSKSKCLNLGFRALLNLIIPLQHYFLHLLQANPSSPQVSIFLVLHDIHFYLLSLCSGYLDPPSY